MNPKMQKGADLAMSVILNDGIPKLFQEADLDPQEGVWAFFTAVNILLGKTWQDVLKDNPEWPWDKFEAKTLETCKAALKLGLEATTRELSAADVEKLRAKMRKSVEDVKGMK